MKKSGQKRTLHILAAGSEIRKCFCSCIFSAFNHFISLRLYLIIQHVLIAQSVAEVVYNNPSLTCCKK